MKWFVRLFLFLIFCLLSEYGLHACLPQGHCIDSKTKVTNNIAAENLSHWDNNPLRFASHGFIRKEYKKIRGTNVEEDDEENINFVKKAKNLRSNTPRLNSNIYPLSVSSQAIAQLSHKPQTSQINAVPFYLNNGKLYTAFQVFRI